MKRNEGRTVCKEEREEEGYVMRGEGGEGYMKPRGLRIKKIKRKGQKKNVI